MHRSILKWCRGSSLAIIPWLFKLMKKMTTSLLHPWVTTVLQLCDWGSIECSNIASPSVFGSDFWGHPTKRMLVNGKFSLGLFSRSLQTCCCFLPILQKFQMQTKLAGFSLWSCHNTLHAPWKWTHVKQRRPQDELKSNTYSIDTHPGPYSEISEV